jgi:hypothetical protein
MIRRLIKATLWLVALAAALVVYFAYPVGHCTLYEHSRRIASTEPAQELGRDLGAIVHPSAPTLHKHLP